MQYPKGRVELIILETDVSELLKHVCKQENVSLKIVVVMIRYCLHLELIPDILCILIL